MRRLLCTMPEVAPMLEAWYHWLNYLPYSWLNFNFMKNALLGVILVAPIFGLTGAMVVNNRMAFFSDAIGHAALTGIAVGVILGMGNPLWAMLAFAVLLAMLISWAGMKTEAAPDTIIGVFFASAVALGVVILSRGGGFAQYSRYLIGDLLSIAPRDLVLLVGILLTLLLFWGLWFNRLFLVSFSPTVARSRGVGIFGLQTVFAVLVAAIVTVSIQWVGLLIINALIILPAAAARNIARGMRSYHLIAIVISLVSGISGLILSFYWSTATGATIVLCAFVIYLATVLWRGLANS
jgi:zinc transport system permease protein